MTIPGIALFYAGMVRKKNILSTLAQSVAICMVASLLWWIVGYSLAFAEGTNFVGGLSKAFFSGIGIDTVSGTIPEVLFIFFQMTFAVLTPALIVGSWAERMKFLGPARVHRLLEPSRLRPHLPLGVGFRRLLL